MPTARICPLSDVTDRLPTDCFPRERIKGEHGAELAAEQVLHIQGDLALPHLHLNAALDRGSALLALVTEADAGAPVPPEAPYLLLVEGDLHIAGALTADAKGTVPHLIVLGAARLGNAVVADALVQVQQGLVVEGLLWGDYNHGELRVQGGLQARVALFTDEFHVHVAGPEQVEFLLDEVRGVPHRAEFSSEIMGAVFPAEFHDGIDAGERFIVKLILVKPGGATSLQVHSHRAEHWVVVRGTAQVTRGDETFLLRENESTYIPLGQPHRLANPGEAELELIEVQSGSVLSEDDIVRLDDQYGRMPK